MDVNVPVHHVYFALICGLLISGFVIELIRRCRLQERYAALWIMVALVFMTYGWWLTPMVAVANWLRIGDVVSVVLFFGFFLCALLILQLSVKVSEFSNKIKNLVQEVSILKHELEQHKSEAAKTGGAGGEDMARTSASDFTGERDGSRDP